MSEVENEEDGQEQTDGSNGSEISASSSYSDVMISNDESYNDSDQSSSYPDNDPEAMIDIPVERITSSSELLSDETPEDLGYADSLKMKNMVRYDKFYNGPSEKVDKIGVIVGLIPIIIAGAIIIGLLIAESDTLNLCGDDSIENDGGLFCLEGWQILANALTMIAIFITIGILLGIWATKKDINVGYTRKTLHFLSFFLQFGINKIFPLESNIYVSLLKYWLITVVFFLAMKQIRRRFKPALLIFRAIDRPADRPYTLKWMFTQYIGSAIAIAPFAYFWAEWSENNDTRYDDLSLLLVIIVGLGDGLAEPIGINFGKHKYRTRALWYEGRMCNGSFERSYEGSFMVLLVSICAIAGFYYIFTTIQLFIAMATVPIIMTLTEAFSPRTWDSPFMFLIGASMLTGIVNISADDSEHTWLMLLALAIVLTIINGFILNSFRKETPEKWYKNEWLFLSVGASVITLATYGIMFYDIIQRFG